jgi:hypothetical protein
MTMTMALWRRYATMTMASGEARRSATMKITIYIIMAGAFAGKIHYRVTTTMMMTMVLFPFATNSIIWTPFNSPGEVDNE